jgi:RNA polymerase sigma-70 factor (ECF subfamily)
LQAGLVSLDGGERFRGATAGRPSRVTATHPRERGATSDIQPQEGGQTVGEVAASVITAAALGDRDAFTEIIRVYEPRLRATAYHVLRESHLVDDVLQDVFVTAFRALPGFRGDAALGTWLQRITYTTCVQYLRRDGRRPRPLETEASRDEVAAEADLAESLGERERLRQALSALTPEQRIAVLLVDRDGYDYRAAAKLPGIPRGTIASRLNGARARLRAALGLGAGPREEGR